MPYDLEGLKQKESVLAYSSAEGTKLRESESLE